MTRKKKKTKSGMSRVERAQQVRRPEFDHLESSKGNQKESTVR
jgi:hypothetical protein